MRIMKSVRSVSSFDSTWRNSGMLLGGSSGSKMPHVKAERLSKTFDIGVLKRCAFNSDSLLLFQKDFTSN